MLWRTVRRASIPFVAFLLFSLPSARSAPRLYSLYALTTLGFALVSSLCAVVILQLITSYRAYRFMHKEYPNCTFIFHLPRDYIGSVFIAGPRSNTIVSTEEDLPDIEFFGMSKGDSGPVPQQMVTFAGPIRSYIFVPDNPHHIGSPPNVRRLLRRFYVLHEMGHVTGGIACGLFAIEARKWTLLLFLAWSLISIQWSPVALLAYAASCALTVAYLVVIVGPLRRLYTEMVADVIAIRNLKRDEFRELGQLTPEMIVPRDRRLSEFAHLTRTTVTMDFLRTMQGIVDAEQRGQQMEFTLSIPTFPRFHEVMLLVFVCGLGWFARVVSTSLAWRTMLYGMLPLVVISGCVAVLTLWYTDRAMDKRDIGISLNPFLVATADGDLAIKAADGTLLLLPDEVRGRRKWAPRKPSAG